MIKGRLDTRGWMRKFDRIGVAVRRMPDVRIVAPGQEHKVKAAIERGDHLDVSPEALTTAQAMLVEGVADIAMDVDADDLTSTAEAIGETLVEDMRVQIENGDVEGPMRSEATRRRKGHDDNLYDTGELAGALDYELVPPRRRK